MFSIKIQQKITIYTESVTPSAEIERFAYRDCRQIHHNFTVLFMVIFYGISEMSCFDAFFLRATLDVMMIRKTAFFLIN